MNVSWSASPADHYVVRSAPEIEGIPEGATKTTQAHLKIPANTSEEPVWYRITVDAERFFDVPSSQGAVVFPVAPGHTLPAPSHTLDGLDRYSVSAVDESGAYYLALSPPSPSVDEQVMHPGPAPTSLIAKHDPQGS